MRKALVILIIAFLSSQSAWAQRGHHHHGRGKGHHKHVVVKRSPYRPHKVVVYRPYWGPRHAFNRRWVFFPARNLYWDNWRNHYVFWNGTIWITQATPPAGIAPEELDKEKKKELKEEEDDVDDVYKSNDSHKEENKEQ